MPEGEERREHSIEQSKRESRFAFHCAKTRLHSNFPAASLFRESLEQDLGERGGAQLTATRENRAGRVSQRAVDVVQENAQNAARRPANALDQRPIAGTIAQSIANIAHGGGRKAELFVAERAAEALCKY